MGRNSKVPDALDLWSPTYPRNVNRRQRAADSHERTIKLLREAEDDETDEPFISVYSFPRGHTKNDNIPRIDTLFIDFDFEGGDYESGSGNRDAWRRDISQLLVRIRRVARHIQSQDTSPWRAALSGHKGVHLFHDFEPLDERLGSFDQYVHGMREYAEDTIALLEDETGIDDLNSYVDVTSSDLGRLCRVPNTKHGTATRSFGEDRFCVPVSIDELATITTDNYEALTAGPREVPWDERSPNAEATEVIERYVSSATGLLGRSNETASYTDYSRVREYKDSSKDELTLQDIRFITSDRPCVWEFYKRDDKWEYGAQSHNMELYCIRELIEKRVPISVIKEFFNSAPGYDEEYTENKIKEVIARDYSRFRTDKLLQMAPEFCGYDHCTRCQRIIETQDISTYD